MIKHSNLILSLIVTLFYFSITNLKASNNTDHWTKINDKDGVQVFSTPVKDSDILKIKTQVNIEASISEIQSILDNVKHRKNWIPYLVKSDIIENISDSERIEYSLFSAPWPASDRDFVYQLKQSLNNESKIVYQMSSTEHPAKPDNDDLIRANLIESTYILTAIADQRTQVELIYLADPRGWLPDWIINIIQRILPYKILRNLRLQAERINIKSSSNINNTESL